MQPVLPQMFCIVVERDANGRATISDVLDFSGLVRSAFDLILVRATLLGKEMPTTEEAWQQLIQDAIQTVTGRDEA